MGLDSLTLEEPPSVHQLMQGENTVVNVRSTLREFQNLSLEVAEMSPEISGEVMSASADVSNNCLKLENEILIKISEFKEKLFPPPPPTPTYVPDARESAVAKKEGSFKLEKRRLAKFKGTLREYPTFKKDWQTQMAPKYTDEVQLYELRELVPAKDKIHVEKFLKIDEFWSYMDVEYGNKKELVRDRLAYLRNYRHPKDSRSDAARFQAMYTRFLEVCSDMEKVDSLHLLEHPASIQEFMKLLPTDPRSRYVDYRMVEDEKGTSELTIVKSFMETERKRQKAEQEVSGETSGGSGSGTGNHLSQKNPPAQPSH